MQKVDHFTVREASEKLGVRLDYTYELIWTGRLPARRVDGRWLIPAQAVEARLERKAVARG